MGYLFLGAALLCGAIKGFCGKKTSGIITGVRDSMLVSCCRLFCCILIGAVVMLARRGTLALPEGGAGLLISAVSGVLTAVFVVTWMLAAKYAPYMLIEVFLMLGVLITVLMSFFVFGETVSMRRSIGLVLLPISAILMCSKKNTSAQKLTPIAILMPIIASVSNALVDFLQKYYMETISDADASAHQFYTYIFAAAGLVIFFILSALIANKEEHVETGLSVLSRSAGYIVVMSLCLYANSYFKTEAAGLLDASKTYPLSQGGSLILSTLMAAFLFKEKQSVRSVFGIVLAFVALLIINI